MVFQSAKCPIFKTLAASEKNDATTLKPDYKLKKRIENIVSLIEGWIMKKTVFADPLLPFGPVREANAHGTHLQIAHADPQTKICKRVVFCKRTDSKLKHCSIFYEFTG